MLEETARVVAIEGRDTWVETQRRSSCASCSAQAGCGTSVLAKVLGQRRSRVRVLSDMPLRVGDQVVIGIHEQAMLRGSLAIYAVPIVLLLLGALAGRLGAERLLWGSAEAGSVILGCAGLLAGFMWVKRFTGSIRNDRKYQPVVLRRDCPSPDLIAIK
jgi:sigma-E factor negative regulatory protein RseC